MILVPVKNLEHAKQRLAPLLDRAARTELAQAMLADVLETLGRWNRRPEVALVSGDPFALELAAHYGFEVIADRENPGETAAIAMATELCQARGIPSTLVIPADIPLVQAWELESILDAAPPQGIVLVPAGDGRGTNAIWRCPPGLIPLRFGNDSFRPHLAAAEATGKPCLVLDLPGVALDVDHPADLKHLARLPGESRAQRLARRWAIADFPIAANG